MLARNGRSSGALPVRVGTKTLFVLATLLLTTLVLAGCSSSKPKATAPTPGPIPTPGVPPPCTLTLPATSYPALVPPGAGLPPAKAGFSGAWEGINGDTKATLIVVSVDDAEAHSAYSYGQIAGTLTSEFQPDGTLHQGGTGQFQFNWKLGPTGTTMLATRIEGSAATSFAMKKCTLQ